jgi:hypothetical protein
MRARVILVAFCVALAGCSSSSSSQAEAAPAPSGAKPAVRRDANLITEEELAKSPARNGLQAVQMLRPDWLRGRGATSIRETSPTQVVVYVNEQRLGGPEQLEGLAITAIKSLRHMSASEATNRWGTGHNGGVISVITR